MNKLNSNVQTSSIFCKDCDYLTLPGEKGLFFYCDMFNEHLREVSELDVILPIKCKECINVGTNVY